MGEPNEPTRVDVLAAREMVKARVHPAHHRDIDAGKWDKWGAMEAAYQQLIRERAGAVVTDG